MLDAQRIATEHVVRVLAGHSVQEAQFQQSGAVPDRTRAAVRDLTFGTLRTLGRQRAIVRLLADRGVPDPTTEALLCVALYQLQHTKSAPHAVVDHAVRAARALRRDRSAGFVNAALRRFLREADRLVRDSAATAEGRWSHPDWWVQKLRTQHGEAADVILEAGLMPPPMGLRVNLRRTSVDAYLRRLEDEGISARAVHGAGLLLERPVPARTLPGYEAGDVSVQDLGAQWVPPSLGIRAGHRVLDACAAPGGKSAHMLETADVRLTAVESDPARFRTLSSYLHRLGLDAALHNADARNVREWWDGEAFDRILVDAPCSGSGIVRRHPDAKWLRRPADLTTFSRQQRELLDSLWQLLVPGGKLLYVTCSVFKEENAEVVAQFLDTHRDAGRVNLPAPFPGADGQLLPDSSHDGFFYSLLEKR